MKPAPPVMRTSFEELSEFSRGSSMVQLGVFDSNKWNNMEQTCCPHAVARPSPHDCVEEELGDLADERA